MEDKIKQVLADILNLDENSIDETLSQENVDNWDSLNHINICLALEQEFNVTFDVSEIETMTSFIDILTTLQMKV